jgi:phage baseplate assembly protein W
MIPKVTTKDISISTMATKTFNVENMSLKVDGIQAVKQACYLILNTRRYDYVIYSWNYGVELDDLVGKPKSYVFAEIERRVKEALMMDDRIDSVRDFEYESIGNKIYVTFAVNTIYGGFRSEVTVDV